MPIIGNGDVASILNDRPGACFFASGVSNSTIADPYQFRREQDLLRSVPRELCLFYFSTISQFRSPINSYIAHKLIMEDLVRARFENYNILKIGNLLWGSNPHTFLNALRSLKAQGKPFEIKDEYRYMIEKKDLLLLTDNLPLTGKNEICAFTYMAKVKDIING